MQNINTSQTVCVNWGGYKEELVARLRLVFVVWDTSFQLLICDLA
jgi:hypothetical protein